MAGDRKLEDLVNALATYNGSRDPLSPLYSARNMLCLQEFDKGVATGKLRIFDTHHAGWLACLFDLKLKCLGKSRAKLRGDSYNIRGLVRAYSMNEGSPRYIVRFLRKALNTQEITEDTPLSFFLSDQDRAALESEHDSQRTA